MTTEQRPGIRTTEFWLAFVVVVAGATATVFVDSPWAKVAGIVAAALSAAGYGFSRAQVKQGPSQ